MVVPTAGLSTASAKCADSGRDDKFVVGALCDPTLAGDEASGEDGSPKVCAMVGVGRAVLWVVSAMARTMAAVASAAVPHCIGVNQPERAGVRFCTACRMRVSRPSVGSVSRRAVRIRSMSC